MKKLSFKKSFMLLTVALLLVGGFLVAKVDAFAIVTPGSIEITKYACPNDTTVNRTTNGVGGAVPQGCIPQSGAYFGYVHGNRTDASSPWDDLNGLRTEVGVTNGSGVLTIPSLLPDGYRYWVVETDGNNNALADGDILGLYCEGDEDPDPNHNDNADMTFVPTDGTTHCVAYDKTISIPPTTGSITVVKNTINADGTFNFTVSPGGSFDLTTSGNTANNTMSELTPGTYSVGEAVPFGWDLISATCDDDTDTQDGSTIYNITLDAGQNVTCTFTDRAMGTITIHKNVVNPNDGPVDDPHVFYIKIDDTNQHGVSENSDDYYTGLNPSQTYTITENPEAGYTLVAYSYDEDGDLPGAQITAVAGQNIDLTITNRQNISHIIVHKVTNPAEDQTEFSITAQTRDGSITGGGSRSISAAGGQVDYEVTAGTYRVGELAHEGWTQTGNTCQGLEVAVGATVECTITNNIINNDTPGSITVIKHVINDNGGTKTAEDFNLHVNILQQEVTFLDSFVNKIFSLFETTKAYAVSLLFAPTSFPGNEDGTNVSFEGPSNYTVTEDPNSGYTTTMSEDCSGTITTGQHKTCTITNDDIAPATPPSGGGGGGGGYVQCSDSRDNDGDGLIDTRDPGCHSDGNANNPSSYVSSDNSELNGGQVLGASTGPVPGCGNRTTGFSITTGQSCIGNTGGPIAGCGNRTTGFSITTGQSCIGNTGIGEVLGAETCDLNRTMRFGMIGCDVLELHNKLTTLGFYKGPIDNKFGKLLLPAVKAFQKANPPLKIDGIVGPLTREVLNSL